MLFVRIFVLTLTFSLTLSSTAEAQGFLKKLGIKKESIAGDDLVGKGLREALTKGIGRAVKSTGKTDGYLANEEIKIPIPRALSRIESPLRKAGYGPQIDDFVLSMNRAAEKAAAWDSPSLNELLKARKAPSKWNPKLVRERNLRLAGRRR